MFGRLLMMYGCWYIKEICYMYYERYIWYFFGINGEDFCYLLFFIDKEVILVRVVEYG